MSIAHLGISGQSGDRVPPHDLLAEQSALGAVMLSPKAVNAVLELVRPEDFYIPKHETILTAVGALVRRGEPTDVIAVTDELTKSGELTRAGGAEYLHTLTGLVPTAANAGFYANVVAEKSDLRRMVDAGTRIVQMGYASEGDVSDLADRARREVDQIGVRRSAEVGFTSEEIFEVIDSLGNVPVQVETPWRSLNDAIGGLRPGKLYVVGARPAAGKSVVALQLATVLAARGAVAFSTLEMPRQEQQLRLIAQGAGVPFAALSGAAPLTPFLRERVAVWRAQASLRIAFDDRSSVGVQDVRSFARSVQRKHPLAGVVVDYLQLMSGDSRLPRHEQVADMSRSLKVLARELDVPVIALSQLNRNSEGRADKRPQLADLRESGAIEQDADCVILLHRDLSGSAQADDRFEMLVAKNRQGPVKIADARWDGPYVRVVDR
jgi:replicative DNA helicase